MNYEQILKALQYKDQVSISQGTVRAICEYFEIAGASHVDEETRQLVLSTGKIVLSLDGAQPKKGRPAFWAFTDGITGRVLLTRYLETANEAVLVDIFREIEREYRVPIKAVISDKQRNIVNAVKTFNPNLRHVFCQYHFLHHVREPIASKDSHLLTTLRSEVKNLSVVVNRNFVPATSISPNSLVGEIFEPIGEELVCAIATRGDRFKVFPGMEAYENIKYIRGNLNQVERLGLPSRVEKSLDQLKRALGRLLEENETLVSEIASLAMDFHTIRARLARRRRPGKDVKKSVDRWVKMLQSRLKRRKLEHVPANLKWRRPSHSMTLEDVWQQWVRFVASYEEGLYHAYDDSQLEFTNNAKESLFSRVKHHFKSAFGRDDIQEPFEVHADHYVKVMDIELKPEKIEQVLLATTTALVDAKRHDLHARFATTRRKWRIREIDTGNWDRFQERLNAAKSPI
jgi:regulator of replication initiation timing